VFRFVRLAAAAAIISAVAAVSAAAQELTPTQVAPSVKLVHPGAIPLYQDLDYIFGLTDKIEQKQLANVKEYFDVFLIGIDRTRLFRLDVILGEKTIHYLTSIPLKNLNRFRRGNLDDLGIDSRKQFATLYKLEMENDTGVEVLGFMRIRNFERTAEEGTITEQYAIISKRRAEIPPTLPDPRPPMAELAKKYDLSLDVLNTKNSPEAMKIRRESFQQNTRKELLGLVKQGQQETHDDFALRKLLTEIQLDELARIYVDAKHANLGLVLNDMKKTGVTLDVLLDPLPGSELEASLKLLAQQPSRFANIERTKNAILSGRINHPLDPMRKNNFLRLSKLLRSRTKNTVAAETDSTDEEQANRKKSADLFFDMIDAGINSGVIDGFVEGHSNENGKQTFVGGIREVDGTAIIEVIKLFPKKSRGQQVELNVDEVGDVKIHKFVAATKDHPFFSGFLGSNTVYIGSSREVVWYAAGETALDELKAAIGRVGQQNTGQADDPFVDLLIKPGPWLKLRQARHAGRNESKAILKLRQMAIDAFLPGDDTLTLKLNRVGNRIEGLMFGHPGILRFAGKILADFSKENFDDSDN